MSGISSTARSRLGRLVILLVLFASLSLAIVWIQARRRHAAEQRLERASIETLETLAQNEPENQQIQFQIGRRWMLQGQLIPAHQAFVRAAQLGVNDQESWLAAARSAELLGRHAEATSLLQSFMGLHPDDSRVRRALDSLPNKTENGESQEALRKADALLEQQALEQAAEAYHNVLATHPDSAVALQGIGIALHTLGQKAESFPFLYRAVGNDPKLVQARFLLANVYQEAAFADEAISHYQAVVAQMPENAQAWAMVGILLYQPTSFSAAEDALKRAVALEPANAYYVLSLAEIQSKRKEGKEAEANLRRALSLAPQEPTYRTQLAAFLIDKPTDTDHKEADALLRQVLVDSPDNPFVHFHLGRLLLVEGDVKGAIPHLQTAVERLNDKELVWYNLARAYRLNGDRDKERAALARSDSLRRDRQELEQMQLTRQQTSRDPAVQLRMARLYARQSDPIRALYHYRLCLNLQPQNVQANREGAAIASKLQADEITRLRLFRAIVSVTDNELPHPPK